LVIVADVLINQDTRTDTKAINSIKHPLDDNKKVKHKTIFISTKNDVKFE